jgi:site-specific recombinase XerD
VFIFACFTGYASQDLFALAPEHIIIGMDGKKWLQFNRGKTGQKEDVPVLRIAETIINKYKEYPKCIRNGKLMPVVCNQKFNDYLKKIKEACGTNRELTTHVARHTFATP